MADNWTNITEEDVRTAGLSTFLEAMRKQASTRGENDPLPSKIADAVATLRAAVSVGNDLDMDESKIPNSLRGLCLRMILRRIKAYLEYNLRPDELQQAKDDQSYINRISDAKISFETPDDPGGSGQMQGPENLDFSVSPLVATRDTLGGLL